MHINSWGGLSGEACNLCIPTFSSDIAKSLQAARGPNGSRCLVIGNLRSYGDEVLCPDGRYLRTTRCDRILEIDTDGDTVTAESGVRLDVLQDRLAPLGYMIPVTPGTAYLTLGGAIANDVHGKNHHAVGTFGCFVRKLELARTSGETVLCSASEHPELFAATVGGLGLTGAITWSTIELRRIPSPMLRVTSHRFRDLSEFFDIDARNSDAHEYSVAWIDCLAHGRRLGRGIYSVADHAGASEASAANPAAAGRKRYRASVPFSLPVSPVNRATLAALSFLYYQAHRTGTREVDFRKWLHPLDSIDHWNRLYGRRGFYQFQCVVPRPHAQAAISDLLKAIVRCKQGSFLAVLKNFGDRASPGLMSFPMPGTTLAVDFPNRGASTRELLLELYEIAASAGGRLYPAKDAYSCAHSLRCGYPNFERFKAFIDPGLESMMSRRLGLTA